LIGINTNNRTSAILVTPKKSQSTVKKTKTRTLINTIKEIKKVRRIDPKNPVRDLKAAKEIDHQTREQRS
jgi:hypothetical protein